MHQNRQIIRYKLGETMRKQPYVTITHYKEREFYYLNYAIQTEDGFIPKEIEQFHESEKEKFIERIRQLQKEYPKHQVISLSLTFNQVVKDKEDPNKACAKIYKENYVIQDKIDIGNLPVTLYFSPFALLYEEYKEKLDKDKLTLLIGLFDRKLYIMFATADKVKQSWIIGTRGLTEKQIANRVSKSMTAYYKIAYKFADQVEMLVNDDSPKLLKVLREELSMRIIPTQKTIHYLLHHMGSAQSYFMSSFIKSYLSVAQPQERAKDEKKEIPLPQPKESLEDIALNSLDDIRLSSPADSKTTVEPPKASFVDRAKSTFSSEGVLDKKVPVSLFSFIPLLFVLVAGGYFTMQDRALDNKMNLLSSQSLAQSNATLLSMTSKDVFGAMGKNAELQSATISTEDIELKGVVWGIEPLRNSLDERFPNGEFVIKPLENFMTEFSFKSKV